MKMICGIHLRAGGPAPGLDAVLAALPRRETDVDTAWTEGAAGLGWCAEAVPGEAGPERLPLVDRCAGLAVTASARLDDRDTLSGGLGVLRAERGSVSDGELILRAYGRWGCECPAGLLGDYAFAVWDAKRGSLFCARDHIGARCAPWHRVRVSAAGPVRTGIRPGSAARGVLEPGQARPGALGAVPRRRYRGPAGITTDPRYPIGVRVPESLRERAAPEALPGRGPLSSGWTAPAGGTRTAAPRLLTGAPLQQGVRRPHPYRGRPAVPARRCRWRDLPA